MALNRAQLDADSRVGLELGRRLSAANATPEQVLRDIRVITGATNAEVMNALSGVRGGEVNVYDTLPPTTGRGGWAIGVANFFGNSLLNPAVSQFKNRVGIKASFGDVFNELVRSRINAGGATISREQAMVEVIDELYGGLMLRSDLANVDDGVVTEMSKYLSTKLNGRKFDDLEGRPTLRVALSHLNRVAGVGQASLNPDVAADALTISAFRGHRERIGSINKEIAATEKLINDLEALWKDTSSLLNELTTTSKNLSESEQLLREFSAASSKSDDQKLPNDKILISRVLRETGSSSAQQAIDVINSRIVDYKNGLKEKIVNIPIQLNKFLVVKGLKDPELKDINEFLSNIYEPNKGNVQKYGMLVDEFSKLVHPASRQNLLNAAAQDASDAKTSADNEVKDAKAALKKSKDRLTNSLRKQADIATYESAVTDSENVVKQIKENEDALRKAQASFAATNAELIGKQAVLTAAEKEKGDADKAVKDAEAAYKKVPPSTGPTVNANATGLGGIAGALTAVLGNKSPDQKLADAQKNVDTAKARQAAAIKALAEAERDKAVAEGAKKSAESSVNSSKDSFENVKKSAIESKVKLLKNEMSAKLLAAGPPHDAAIVALMGCKTVTELTALNTTYATLAPQLNSYKEFKDLERAFTQLEGKGAIRLKINTLKTGLDTQFLAVLGGLPLTPAVVAQLVAELQGCNDGPSLQAFNAKCIAHIPPIPLNSCTAFNDLMAAFKDLESFGFDNVYALQLANSGVLAARSALAAAKSGVVDPAGDQAAVKLAEKALEAAEFKALEAGKLAAATAAAAAPAHGAAAPTGLHGFLMTTTIGSLRTTLGVPSAGATPATGLIAARETEINALNGLRVAAPIPYDVEKLVMERIFMGPNAPLLGSLSDEELSKRILIEVNRINYWNMNPVDGLGPAHTPLAGSPLPTTTVRPPATVPTSYTDDQLAQLAELQMLEGRNELKRTGNFAERLAGINDPRLREMLVGKLAVTPQLRAMGIKNTRAWTKLTLQEKIEKSEGKFSTSFKQRVLGMKFIKDSAKGEESPFEGLDTSDLNNWESIERSLASGILSVESAFYLLAALKDFFAGSPFDGESEVNIMENLSNYLYERVFEEIKAKAATETPVPSTVEIEKRANAEFKKRVMGSEKTTKAWLSHYDKNSKDVENNFVKNLNARFKVLKLNYANGQIDSDEFDRQYKELVDEARERNALKLVDFYSNRRGVGAIFNGFAGGRLKWMGPFLQKAYSKVANAGVKPTLKLAWDAAKGVKGFAGAALKGGWGLIWNPIRLVGLTTAGLYNSFADPDDKIKDAAGQTLGVSQALGATLADIKGAGSYFVGAARGVKGSLIGSEVDGKNGFLGDFVGGWKSLKEDREKALEKAEKKLKKAEELMNIGPLDLTGSAPRKAVEAPAPVAQAPAVPEVKAPESASAEDLKKVEDYLPTLPKHAIAPLSSMLTSVRTGKKAEAEAYAKVLLAKSIPQEVVNYLQVLTEDQVKQIHKKMTDLKLIGDKKVKSEESAAKAA